MNLKKLWEEEKRETPSLSWDEWIIGVVGAVAWVIALLFSVMIVIAAGASKHPIPPAFLGGLAIAWLWHHNPDTWFKYPDDKEMK